MTRKKKLLIAGISAAAALAAVYVGLGIFFQGRFCFGTTVNGIKAGGKTAKQVEAQITAETDNYVLTLAEREGASETVSGESISLAPVFDGGVAKLLREQNGFLWPIALICGDELGVEQAVTYDADALDAVLAELSCVTDGREPVSAGVSEYEDGGYTLVPADYGTTVDWDALKEAVENAVLALADELDLDGAGCYVEPEVGDDDEALLALIDKMNQYVGTTITYDFDETTETLSGDVISEWLSVDKAGRLSVDEDAVLTYVKSLAKKYNTCYHAKTLETSYGETVTITNGPYGWKIDNSGEVEQILADLEAGEDVTREPVYSQTANSHGENDYGDSYVEINLTAQHLFCYKDGELVVESDLVSGNLSKGYGTPSGAYMVTYKERDAVLRGETYATPVNYWMPFNGDIGMHDMPSRKSFGGNIYKTNGSRGCINLPYAAAEKIYETIEKGYCVLVYELPGTESEAVKQKEAQAVTSAIDAIGTVTLESAAAVADARAQYDALSSAAKGYVANYQTLVDAEAALAALQAAQPVTAAPAADTATTDATAADTTADGT